MTSVIIYYHGSKYPMPLQAPEQQVVEFDTSIKAWHDGPLRLVTQIPSISVRNNEKLFTGIWFSAISAIASFSFPGFAGRCLVGISVASLLCVSDTWIGGPSTPELERYQDCIRERKAIMERLELIEGSVAIEVLPGRHDGTVKTYDFSRGHFAKAWAVEHQDQYCGNPLKIIVRDSGNRILEIAESPGSEGVFCC